jgi:antitoxin PrlF
MATSSKCFAVSIMPAGSPSLSPHGTLIDGCPVTSKGQVTVPKAVREALGIREGDKVVFRVEGNRAILARTPDFLDLAGSVRVPAAKRNVAWDEVLRRTRADRAAARR